MTDTVALSYVGLALLLDAAVFWFAVKIKFLKALGVVSDEDIKGIIIVFSLPIILLNVSTFMMITQ